LSTFVVLYFIKTEVLQKQHKPKKQESRKHGPAALKSQVVSPSVMLLVIGVLGVPAALFVTSCSQFLIPKLFTKKGVAVQRIPKFLTPNS